MMLFENDLPSIFKKDLTRVKALILDITSDLIIVVTSFANVWMQLAISGVISLAFSPHWYFYQAFYRIALIFMSSSGQFPCD
ncbi:hypothetical protein CEXT_257091 [Caerostris extrusa]|uniref:Uncharacterized protein n=1 Tax=Caerostris extrusa TaxID=172846 RepID=A0AAV4TI72_CAEEX|nr:hypothetical protein CEXT_257091 [Caerostris extrusa]